MPNDRGKVSIISPTYNHAPFIGSCIESVLAQTYPNWEMVIVDDGSTDGTAEKVQAYQDPRIIYLRLDHGGLERLGERYNLALTRSNGEFVAILEGDDFWPDDKLERQVSDFRDPRVVLSSGLYRTASDAGELNELMPRVLPPRDALLNEPLGTAAVSMLCANYLTFTFPVATVVRRSALEAIGGFNQPPYLPLVDYPTFLQLSLRGRWTFHLHVLGYWRRHDGSVTTNRFLEILDGVHRYAVEFVAANRVALPLTEAERVSLNDDWRLMQVDRLVLTGLQLLKDGEFKRARAYFARLQGFPVTRKWKIVSRIMQGFSSAHANPALVRRLIRSKIPCRLQMDDLSRFVSSDLPPERIEPRVFR